MTVTGNQHRQIVDHMLKCIETPTDKDAFMRRLVEIAPTATWTDLERAQADADGIFKERIAVEQAEVAELRRLKGLFDGMPEGMELGDCAVIKAKQGDPLAIEFCQSQGIPV